MSKEEILNHSDIDFEQLSEEEAEGLKIILDAELMKWESERIDIRKKEQKIKKKKIIIMFLFLFIGTGILLAGYFINPDIAMIKRQNREIKMTIAGLETEIKKAEVFSEDNLYFLQEELIRLEQELEYSILLSDKEEKESLAEDLREYTKRMNDLSKVINLIPAE